jgi:hypothetical protein
MPLPLYVFIEGNGLSSMENPLIVANENGTAIFINDMTTPITTINAGQYYLVPNSYYQGTTNNKNMHEINLVTCKKYLSKNISRNN